MREMDYYMDHVKNTREAQSAWESQLFSLNRQAEEEAAARNSDMLRRRDEARAALQKDVTIGREAQMTEKAMEQREVAEAATADYQRMLKKIEAGERAESAKQQRRREQLQQQNIELLQQRDDNHRRAAEKRAAEIAEMKRLADMQKAAEDRISRALGLFS